MPTPYPKWEELPEIDLYLDQVLLYVNQVTSSAISQNDKLLTASMVNNYVKHGHLSKPLKKKYNRSQVARLIVVTALKNVFAIQEICQTLELLTAANGSQESYDGFVTCMNDAGNEQLPEVVVSACETLKLYYKTHELVKKLGGKTNEN